jgi:5'-nucleotidase
VKYYWLTGEFVNLEPDATDTDEWALKNNYISVVPIKVDFTCYNTINKIKNWENDFQNET